MPDPLELEDLQGLVVSSYAHLPCAAYRVLRVTERSLALAWLAARTSKVTASVAKNDEWSWNIAFTLEGLAALGIAEEARARFPLAMQDGGMASARRSRVLGDFGSQAPSQWQWGGPNTPPAHVLVLYYARDETELERQLAIDMTGNQSGFVEVVTLRGGREPDSKEHFGFLDGVGQPVVEGSGRLQTQLARTRHATVVAAGEFVLGYLNSDQALPISPTMEASADPGQLLQPVPGASGRHDLGRNGTYMVFRQLKQDVAGFWRDVRSEAERLWPHDPVAATRLASKMVGRWPSGAALVLYPDADPFGGVPQQQTENDFAYDATDPFGRRCPVGAHIRRANPRDSLGPDPESARASANRHRLLRRGRSYGPRAIDPTQEDGIERGLHFICLNADLERQFELVQQTWLANPAFGGLAAETDPLTTDGERSSLMFSIPRDPIRLRARRARSYVTMVGGAYWFLPGISALRWISSSKGE